MDARTRRRDALLARKRQLAARAVEASDQVYGWKLDQDRYGRMRFTWTADHDPFAALLALTYIRGELLHQLEEELVATARLQGYSWENISWALGVTRQAARKRHPKVEDVVLAEMLRFGGPGLAASRDDT